MTRTQLTITTDNPLHLIATLQDGLDQHHAIVDERVVVLITEHFALSTLSTLQCTIVVVLHDATTCRVEIVSGGGRAGLAKVDYGAERRQNRRIVRDLERICRHYGWTIVEEHWT